MIIIKIPKNEASTNFANKVIIDAIELIIKS